MIFYFLKIRTTNILHRCLLGPPHTPLNHTPTPPRLHTSPQTNNTHPYRTASHPSSFFHASSTSLLLMAPTLSHNHKPSVSTTTPLLRSPNQLFALSHPSPICTAFPFLFLPTTQRETQRAAVITKNSQPTNASVSGLPRCQTTKHHSLQPLPPP